MNSVSLKKGKLYINGVEINDVSSLVIKKEASNPTELTVKFDAEIVHFDDENYFK